MLKDFITGLVFYCPKCNHLIGSGYHDFETLESNHEKHPRTNQIEWQDSNFFVGNCDGCGVEIVFKRKRAKSFEDYDITILEEGKYVLCKIKDYRSAPEVSGE